jgi:hypothetical protein
MRIHQITDLLEAHMVRPATSEATVDNIALSRITHDDEEAELAVKRQMSASLVRLLADDVLKTGDWHTVQTARGVRFTVSTYLMPQRQLFDLLRAAYALGAQDWPITPMDFK